jgi:hypothetical protein
VLGSSTAARLALPETVRVALEEIAAAETGWVSSSRG